MRQGGARLTTGQSIWSVAGPAAEEHYLDAIERLEQTRMAGETAHAHLVYGE